MGKKTPWQLLISRPIFATVLALLSSHRGICVFVLPIRLPDVVPPKVQVTTTDTGARRPGAVADHRHDADRAADQRRQGVDLS